MRAGGAPRAGRVGSRRLGPGRVRSTVLLAAALLVALPGVPQPAAHAAGTPRSPLPVYGAWHCGDDACTWGRERSVAEFDSMNHWLVDRGAPDHAPSVNLVVLSFVNPLKLLNGANDTTTKGGVPLGMTKSIVDYFNRAGIRVAVSIGGITYTADWNTALAANATLLGQRAAELASTLGVDVEIDYEENRTPNLEGLQQFIAAYRERLPYDPDGKKADGTIAPRLTIDLAAGGRWLIAITRKATAEWLRTDAPVLDYANAMVPSKQPSASAAIASWQEHVDGKPRYDPPIPPLAPAKFTGSVYLAGASSVRPECNSFDASLQKATGSFVQNVAPNGAGTTSGMLGYMFWAAERASSRGKTTQPPNTCEGGVGVGARTYGVGPMGALPSS